MVLHPVNAGQPLHVSDQTLLDHPECKEVNADPAGTSWKICLFMECREDKNDILKGVSEGVCVCVCVGVGVGEVVKCALLLQ